MIGSIVYATDQGLGILAKSFVDNGVIDRVLVQPHSRHETRWDWYPERFGSPESLIRESDIILFFETPFNWNIVRQARNMGKKTVMMPMYECTQYPFPEPFDLVIAPSALDLEVYKNEPNVVHIPVPVEETWRQRTHAKVFVHNAGHGGIGGRNGTRELLDAMRYVKSDIKLIVRSQEELPYKVRDPRIEYRIGTFPKETLWREGDVFIFPEKFNGLSLPIQEAYASGMLVMAGDRFPNNTYLPKEPLIPVSGYDKQRTYVDFDSAKFEPAVIAKHIDKWYNQDITKYSLMGREWANKNSWKELKQVYLDALSL